MEQQSLKISVTCTLMSTAQKRPSIDQLIFLFTGVITLNNKNSVKTPDLPTSPFVTLNIEFKMFLYPSLQDEKVKPNAHNLTSHGFMRECTMTLLTSYKAL